MKGDPGLRFRLKKEKGLTRKRGRENLLGRRAKRIKKRFPQKEEEWIGHAWKSRNFEV